MRIASRQSHDANRTKEGEGRTVSWRRLFRFSDRTPQAAHLSADSPLTANRFQIWCPGPESNRYGVASEGFSYHYSFHC